MKGSLGHLVVVSTLDPLNDVDQNLPAIFASMSSCLRTKHYGQSTNVDAWLPSLTW